jgi:hypothetical protein
VSPGQRRQRQEVRKFKRIPVRYGHPAPRHPAAAQRITTRGFFLATNEIVYAEGSPIAVEITGPGETWVVQGIVRHAFKVHPTLASYTRPGMGVELTVVPDACRAFLASL